MNTAAIIGLALIAVVLVLLVVLRGGSREHNHDGAGVPGAHDGGTGGGSE